MLHGKDDGGRFGEWGTDDDGLPCFDLKIDAAQRLVLPEGGAGALWHQLGNDSITALAHADGAISIYAARGGLVRLTGESGCRVSSPAGLPGAEVRWGVGYAQWKYALDGARMVRRVFVPPGGAPFLMIETTRDADADAGQEALQETWTFRPYPLIPGPLMSRNAPPPAKAGLPARIVLRAMFAVSGALRSLTDTVRRAVGATMRLHIKEGNSDRVTLASRPGVRRRTRRSLVPRLLDDVFISSLSGCVLRAEQAHGAVEVLIEPRPVGTSRLAYAVGLEPSRSAGEVARQVRTPESASGWSALSAPVAPGSPLLSREAAWHAYYLKSAAITDEVFDCRYVPQGSAYGFVHGFQGAPRDYAITAAAMAYVDPHLARDIVRMIMLMTAPDGSIYYGHAGAGACVPGIVHGAPTDLPLFLLWAIDEYLSATGDIAFLDQVVPFYDGRRRGGEGTVRERIVLAWTYLRDEVGRGEHGMLRAGSGDWSDPLALMVRDRRAFRGSGESGFNTGMGAYVLPRAAALIRDVHPDVADDMNTFASLLRLAMEQAWQGRWFIRGWDGRGNPIGGDHLFLDGQVWCLIGKVGDAPVRAALIDSIEEMYSRPSPIGPTILDRPHHVKGGILAAGTDCNAGVWAAINGLLAWGYALHDTGLAWRCLESQSLAAHARAYPVVWFGIWSGPDSYNAHYAERPGETFIHPATPMQEFPVMNSNAHAGPLLGLIKTNSATG
jgi:hypothetical protein